MKYESDILKRLINTYGVVGNPRYISEIIKEFIVRGKECYPNLFTYQSDWLAHIDEFGLTPEYTVSYTGQHIYAPNTLERPVKSAILKGNTMVNLTTTASVSGSQVVKYVDSKMTTNKTITIKLVIPSEVSGYIIQINNVTDNSYKRNITVTTNNYLLSLSSDEMVYWIRGMVSDGWDVNNQSHTNAMAKAMIIEGDYTNIDIPYFTGMQSVKMPVLTTTGKNLFDKTIKPIYVGGNGVVTYPNGNYGFEWQVVKPNTSYVLSYNVDNNSYKRNEISYYTKDKVYIKTEAKPLGLFTTPNNAHYIVTRLTITNEPSNIQLEDGTVATSYEPYKSNILTVNGDVTLRGIGDVEDTLDCLTGEVTERIGEVLLDGSEEWSINNSNNEGFFSCSTTTYIGVPNGKVISDKLPSVTSTKTEGVMMGVTTGKLLVSFNRDKTGVTSLAKFKEKLAQLQLKVCYEIENVDKTVGLTIHDKDQQKVEQLTSFDGGTHFTTSSQEGSLLPSLTVDVVTDLEETLNLCSTDGNTL